MASNESALTDDVAQAWSLMQVFFENAQDPAVLDDLVVRLNDALLAEIPEVVGLRADFDVSTRALLVAFFTAAAADPEAAIVIDSGVLDLARTLAIKTPDLGVLLRAYRIGQRLAWREFTAILTREVADPELRLAAMSFLFERLSVEIERVVDASVVVFTAEREQWLGGALARKSELVAALLDGEASDIDEATRVLGHRLHPGQLAILLWQDDSADGSDALSRLEAVARALAVALKAPAPLLVPEGARSVSAWLNVAHDPEAVVLAESLAEGGRGVHLAAGAVSPGVAGFRTSQRQAVLARRVALASEVPAAVTDYRSVAVISPFLDDREALAELVATELAGLASRDENGERLRETTLAYLRTGGARGAALALGVHKNTVLYRLRGIEEALGHPLTDRRLSLQVALELVERLGPKVLP
jgi:DNA-binding PucR family transcriptional regulator